MPVSRIALLACSLLLAGCAIEGHAVATHVVPDESHHDPSLAIPGIEVASYAHSLHVGRGQRVAYDRMPPMGGPHDAIWADCTGVVYPDPVRTELAVHSLEHGAVWIAYDPDRLSAGQVAQLARYAKGVPYMLMSPFPGLGRAVSLQGWGHQLKVDNVSDLRIGQFISALRLNPYTVPEMGATCQTIPGMFDPAKPPAFDPSPVGPDAVRMDGTGADVTK